MHRPMQLPPDVPEPAAMPVDKQAWLSRLHISNFVNAFHQYEDVVAHTDGKRILVIGPGQGLEVAVFRSQGYDVTSYDIDAEIGADFIGSVHDMKCFAAKSFDVVIASHVLEHMSFALFDAGLREIARVGRYALIYLPYAGRHVELGLVWRQAYQEKRFVLNVPPFWRKPSLVEPRFAGGQHFWEVGVRGCSVRKIRSSIQTHFDVLAAYQNPDWLVSMNFVLASRRRRI